MPNRCSMRPVRAIAVEHDEIDVPVGHLRGREGRGRHQPSSEPWATDPVRLVGHDAEQGHADQEQRERVEGQRRGRQRAPCPDREHDRRDDHDAAQAASWSLLREPDRPGSSRRERPKKRVRRDHAPWPDGAPAPVTRTPGRTPRAARQPPATARTSGPERPAEVDRQHLGQVARRRPTAPRTRPAARDAAAGGTGSTPRGR